MSRPIVILLPKKPGANKFALHNMILSLISHLTNKCFNAENGDKMKPETGRRWILVVETHNRVWRHLHWSQPAVTKRNQNLQNNTEKSSTRLGDRYSENDIPEHLKGNKYFCIV